MLHKEKEGFERGGVAIIPVLADGGGGGRVKKEKSFFKTIL